jgi:ubiquinone/menaquinone biosynthesis C-methylase UbiE
MLNPAFPQQPGDKQLATYILGAQWAQKTFENNASLASGKEWRLQDVYGNEIWTKLQSLRLADVDWAQCDVLDICAGSGFLSFHLLKRIRPRSLTLLDASSNEVEEARKLLSRYYPNVPVTYVTADVMGIDLASISFDVILGNSFLHHLYNMPHAVKELGRLLKPGGIFATLHEPTPGAIAYESGSWRLVLKFLLQGPAYVEKLRTARISDQVECVDIWLFEFEQLQEVFERGGFEHVVVRGWHIARPFVVAVGQLHLHHFKPMLTLLEAAALRWAVSLDAMFQHILPLRLFGSLALTARKPESETNWIS